MSDSVEQLEPHRQYLRAVLYRLTGDAAESDDLVQETFARAIARPRLGEAGPLRPWLTRVAVNLGVDSLRARRAHGYSGAWLPYLVETGDEASVETPSARYDLVESATIAFLVALEALSTQQRVVLLLRDVFELSVDEVAAALETSGNSVKVAHHRARAVLAAYDESRVRPTRSAQRRSRALLESFVAAVLAGDVAAVTALLSEGVVATSDGGGRYASSPVPIVGAARVARLYLQLAKHLGPHGAIALGMVNGWPALLTRMDDPPGRNSPLSVLQLIPDAQGQAARLYAVVVPEKVRAIAWLKE